jgi:hypothetical protein
MKITFTDGRTFESDASKIKLTNVEAMAIEKVTGLDLGDFHTRLKAGSALAVTAWVWVLAKRQEPTLRFSEVEFDMTELAEQEGPTGEEIDDEPDPTLPLEGV